MKKIIKQLVFVFVAYYIVSLILFKLNAISYLAFIAFLVSGLINILNSMLSLAAFNLGNNKSNKNFLIYIFGGMVFRLFFILICVFLVLFLLKLSLQGFIFSLFILYFVVLILEVNFYRLKIPEKKI